MFNGFPVGKTATITLTTTEEEQQFTVSGQNSAPIQYSGTLER